VVDNASSDGTLARVRARTDVTVVANAQNAGFARAVNQALEHVRGRAVLLVNPDCVVPPPTAEALTQLVCEHPDIAIAGPRIRAADGTVAISAHPFETGTLASRFGGSLIPVPLRRLLSRGARRESYMLCHDGGTETPVDWVSGACLAIRASLLRELGGMDTGYFMYYEDEELCLQARHAGARVAYLPSVEAVHMGGASSTDPASVWPHLYRSMLRFHARHRRSTYQVVRGGIALRAAIGVLLGAPRDVAALARHRPARRALAWWRIGRVALASPAGRCEGWS
jgi:GT2 family glycosyltransferase